MSCYQHRPVHTTPSTCATCRRLRFPNDVKGGNLPMMETSQMKGPSPHLCFAKGIGKDWTTRKPVGRKGQKQTVSCQVRSSEHFFPAKTLTDLWLFVCGQWIFARFSKDFSWWRQCMLETQHGKASGIISCHRSSILWENNFTCTLRCQTRKHSPGQGCSLHDIYGFWFWVRMRQTHIWMIWP